MQKKRTQLYLKLKRKRVASIIYSFLRQARQQYYERYQQKYLNDEFIQQIISLDDNRAAIQAELAQLSFEQLDIIERRHTDVMPGLGMAIDYAGQKDAVESLIKEVPDVALRTVLRNSWRYGDTTVRNAVIDYFDDVADVRFDLDPREAQGKATIENGKLVYHISNNFAHEQSPEELLRATVIFSHEAYRHGDGRSNKFNTREAVLSEMSMINNLVENYGQGFLAKEPEMLLAYYIYSNFYRHFNTYVDTIYQTGGGDYLKISNLKEQIEKMSPEDIMNIVKGISQSLIIKENFDPESIESRTMEMPGKGEVKVYKVVCLADFIKLAYVEPPFYIQLGDDSKNVLGAIPAGFEKGEKPYKVISPPTGSGLPQNYQGIIQTISKDFKGPGSAHKDLADQMLEFLLHPDKGGSDTIDHRLGYLLAIMTTAETIRGAIAPLLALLALENIKNDDSIGFAKTFLGTKNNPLYVLATPQIGASYAKAEDEGLDELSEKFKKLRVIIAESVRKCLFGYIAYLVTTQETVPEDIDGKKFVTDFLLGKLETYTAEPGVVHQPKSNVDIWQEKVRSCQVNINNVKDSIEELTAAINEVPGKIEALQESVAQLEDGTPDTGSLTSRDIANIINERRNDIRQLQAEKKKLQVQKNQAIAKLKQYEGQLIDLQKKLADLEA